MKNDFIFARLRLVALYLLIIASVIVLFSYLVIRQADDAEHTASTGEPLVLSAEEVEAKARVFMKGKEITDAEYEIEHGALLYTVEFEGDEDVKGNLFTGEVTIDESKERSIETLTDDFEEIVVWIGLAVFLLAGLLSSYVAGQTLAPILKNIEKQKQFVSGAAHELRNPLAALHSRIEGALRGARHEAGREVLQDLLQETKRLIQLSEELLVIERDEERKRDIRACSVEKSIEVVLARLAPLINERQVSVEQDVELAPLRIDSRDLETVLYNLLHNAVKFSPTGGILRVSWKNGMLKVADEGPGIAPEHQSRMFDRFYKVHPEAEGSGLGLALVRDIITRYSGTIEVGSVRSRGAELVATFRITSG